MSEPSRDPYTAVVEVLQGLTRNLNSLAASVMEVTDTSGLSGPLRPYDEGYRDGVLAVCHMYANGISELLAEYAPSGDKG